jgi:hypothetical protein
MDDDSFFVEVEVIADTVCATPTLVDDFKLAFREAQRCH